MYNRYHCTAEGLLAFPSFFNCKIVSYFVIYLRDYYVLAFVKVND